MSIQVSKAMFPVAFVKLFSLDDWKTNFDLFPSTENSYVSAAQRITYTYLKKKKKRNRL